MGENTIGKKLQTVKTTLEGKVREVLHRDRPEKSTAADSTLPVAPDAYASLPTGPNGVELAQGNDGKVTAEGQRSLASLAGGFELGSSTRRSKADEYASRFARLRDALASLASGHVGSAERHDMVRAFADGLRALVKRGAPPPVPSGEVDPLSAHGVPLPDPTWVPRAGLYTNNYDGIAHRMLEAAAKRGYQIETLGTTDDGPVFTLTPGGPPRPELPKVLVVSGIHGNEPSGYFAILDALENLPKELFEKAQISFLPLAAPSSVRNFTRRNAEGDDTNRGLITQPGATDTPAPSLEGRILKANAERLRALGADGVLTLHEDWEVQKPYLYANEPGSAPSDLVVGLRDSLDRFYSGTLTENVEGTNVVNGISFNAEPGSTFEDLMVSLGVPLVVCTEQPGLAPVQARVDGAAMTIRNFVGAVADRRGEPPSAAS